MNEDVKAAAAWTCDTEGHHWCWTRPLDSSIECWVGVCSICRRIKVEAITRPPWRQRARFAVLARYREARQ